MSIATVKQTSKGYWITFQGEDYYIGTDHDEAVRECEMTQQEYDLEQEVANQETAEREGLGEEW